VQILALTQFENQPKEELSFVEIAQAILDEKRDTMPFKDIVSGIQNFLGLNDDDIKARLAQFYTDLNVDGSFISLGGNVWGLRAWYPVDAIDENIHGIEEDVEDEDAPKRKKAAKKVNVFAGDVADDDVIDYNDDDPEDDDFAGVEDEDADAQDADVETDEEEVPEDADLSLEDNMAELAGEDDLDDLSDGDEER
jgi:DNA-directed RNA polymerase subunit delta